MPDTLAQIKALAVQYPEFCQVLPLGKTGSLVIISMGHNWDYPYAGITWSDSAGLEVRIHDSKHTIPQGLALVLSEARRLLLVQKGVIPGTKESENQENLRNTCPPMAVSTSQVLH